jgi:hypothetical protein
MFSKKGIKKDIKDFFDRGIAPKCPAVITPLPVRLALTLSFEINLFYDNRGTVRAFYINQSKR